MRPAASATPHRAAEAARPRSRAVSAPPAPAGHRIRLASPAERDGVAGYLSGGGWLVEPVGRRDLRAHYPRSRGDGSERVNLRFSLALWRALNDPVGPRFEIA